MQTSVILKVSHNAWALSFATSEFETLGSSVSEIQFSPTRSQVEALTKQPIKFKVDAIVFLN